MRTLDLTRVGSRFMTRGVEHVVLSMGYHIDGEPIVTVAPTNGSSDRRDLGHGWSEPACVTRLEGWWHCATFEAVA